MNDTIQQPQRSVLIHGTWPLDRKSAHSYIIHGTVLPITVARPGYPNFHLDLTVPSVFVCQKGLQYQLARFNPSLWRCEVW